MTGTFGGGVIEWLFACRSRSRLKIYVWRLFFPYPTLIYIAITSTRSQSKVEYVGKWALINSIQGTQSDLYRDLYLFNGYFEPQLLQFDKIFGISLELTFGSLQFCSRKTSGALSCVNSSTSFQLWIGHMTERRSCLRVLALKCPSRLEFIRNPVHAAGFRRLKKTRPFWLFQEFLRTEKSFIASRPFQT